MNSSENAVEKTVSHVKEKFEGEGTGHDWFHIERVWNNAKHIAEKEGVDQYVVQLAALLHDIADWKFHDGDEKAGSREARKWLESIDVNEDVINKVCEIIDGVSYKGAKVDDSMETLEGKVVQDADRLDAMGAIGIARAFAYGGSKDRPLYDPDVEPELHDDPQAYVNSDKDTLSHFHEKLLLLKDRMKTETGREIAEDRHKYMEEFLEQFHKEWQGQK